MLIKLKSVPIRAERRWHRFGLISAYLLDTRKQVVQAACLLGFRAFKNNKKEAKKNAPSSGCRPRYVFT